MMSPQTPLNADPHHSDAEDEPDMTLEQFLNKVVEITIAVMINQPEKKGEWWQALGQFQTQARRHADRERMNFFDALRQLVEGASPERISTSLSEEYQPYWRQILNGIS